MSDSVVVRQRQDLAATAQWLATLSGQADEHAAHSLAPRTREAYDSDWRQWETWCERFGLAPHPVEPGAVRLYLADMAGRTRTDGTPWFKSSSIERHLAALSYRNYELGGTPGLARHPHVAAVMDGIRNTRKEAPLRRRPLLRDDVARLVEAMDHDRWPAGVAAARDTFALLLGFATAMRRSEVAALRVGDVSRDDVDGLHVRVRSSKTDQAGRGHVLAVPYGAHPVTCVPCARTRWLSLVAAAQVGRSTTMRQVLTTGHPVDWVHVCRGADPAAGLGASEPLLRPVTKGGVVTDRPLSSTSLNQAVKRRAGDAGYDPTHLGFHSLRAGMVTQARRNGADARSVRRQTRHSSDAMVDVYDREHNPLAGNAVVVLGL